MEPYACASSFPTPMSGPIGMPRHVITAIAVAFVLLAFPQPARPAESQPIDPALLKKFEARTFRDPAGAVLKYRLFKPSAAGATATNLPLVLFLHGAAGLGDDNQHQFNGGNEVPPQALTTEVTRARFRC